MPAPTGPDGAGPLLGNPPAAPTRWTGPIGAGSAPTFASLRVLALSLDAISVRASLATPKFPEI